MEYYEDYYRSIVNPLQKAFPKMWRKKRLRKKIISDGYYYIYKLKSQPFFELCLNYYMEMIDSGLVGVSKCLDRLESK